MVTGDHASIMPEQTPDAVGWQPGCQERLDSQRASGQQACSFLMPGPKLMGRVSRHPLHHEGAGWLAGG
jgi:hypothetical protein